MHALKNALPIVLALAGGLYAGMISYPQLVGGWKLLSQENTLDNLAKISASQPMTAQQIAEAIADWQKAAPLLDDGHVWSGLGDVLVGAANDAAPNADTRRAWLNQAADSYRKAIEMSPANGRAWAMLAAVRVQLGATPEEISSLLRMSLRTAPRDPPLVLARLDTAFYIWRILDPDLKSLMSEQIKIATQNYTRPFVQLVRKHYMLEPVRTVLSDDRNIQWTFDREYMHLYP